MTVFASDFFCLCSILFLHFLGVYILPYPNLGYQLLAWVLELPEVKVDGLVTYNFMGV